MEAPEAFEIAVGRWPHRVLDLDEAQARDPEAEPGGEGEEGDPAGDGQGAEARGHRHADGARGRRGWARPGGPTRRRWRARSGSERPRTSEDENIRAVPTTAARIALQAGTARRLDLRLTMGLALWANCAESRPPGCTPAEPPHNMRVWPDERYRRRSPPAPCPGPAARGAAARAPVSARTGGALQPRAPGRRPGQRLGPRFGARPRRGPPARRAPGPGLAVAGRASGRVGSGPGPGLSRPGHPGARRAGGGRGPGPRLPPSAPRKSRPATSCRDTPAVPPRPSACSASTCGSD